MARPTASRGARSQGRVTPLLAGIVSALALTGAAVFTVGHASCGDEGQYVRHAEHVEFIGGCVHGEDLPGVEPGDREGPTARDEEPRNYRP
ncbi:hypothetical protein BJF85_16415 [Saccharomonospora sp. CUA-673]|uniref:hypothetical protein n=1 Tax=Saccharomonospora sp. CUA-673 TaxID=1904969 RepID=UPI00095C395D|nr:hypothetical protein [Saccharomonospora sp. CUA-673]OLT46614.1 hypothetical protein BJF85_16415 [Saccharomonospora sp. CUA-673]